METLNRRSDKEIAGGILRILEGKGIQKTLSRLFPEVIAKIYGPFTAKDENSWYVLQIIVVPKKLREEGLATEYIKEFTRMARQEKIDIALTPDASYQSKGGMSKGKLTQWYKTLGFVKKHKDDFRFMNTYCYYN